jgi:hypothetical protein
MYASLSICLPDIRPWTPTSSARLTVVVLGLVGLASGFPRRCAAQEDLSGRVVDKAGIGVSGAKVWAIGGKWENPETVATTTTDVRGYFAFPHAWGPGRPDPLRFLNLFARVGDGRIGWQGNIWWNHTHAHGLTIVLGPVGPVRGRLNDQDGQPIAGAEVLPVSISRPEEDNPQGQEYLQLSPELAGPLRTKSAADGTFVLDGIPPGSHVVARIAAPGFGKPQVFWDASKPVSIALDGRLGRIEGQFKPPNDRGLPGKLSVSLRRKFSREDRDSAPFQVFYSQTIAADPDGSFRFDDVPPGRYEVFPVFGQESRSGAQGVQDVDVGPKAVARVGMPVHRSVTIAGRILDAQTGKGIAGIGLRSTLLSPQNSLQFIGEAQTDADGRYTIEARPGNVQVQPSTLPKTYLGLWSHECPRLEVTADRAWPDLKLRRAAELDGMVVDAAGQPVVGAEVVVVAPDPRGFGSGGAWTRTGPDGTFHLEQLDPNDTLPLRARTKEATTDGTIVITPKTVEGKVKLTIDPKFAFRIRGQVTDRSGKRIAGATAQVWWSRRYVSGKPDAMGKGISSGLESYTTSEAGWFVFRDLWPGDRYKVVVAAPGRGKVETPEVIGKAGETHDYGSIVLTGFDGHFVGRVVGSDGRPIAGATVFNRGDGPRQVEALTDDQGRFRLESLFPGTKYAFARKDGYRFTGMKVNGDADDLTIAMHKTTEPPPAWKPEATASFDDQRAFARRVLVRLWEEFGEKAEQNGASSCIVNMAWIDPELALQWSAGHGHGYDGRVRQAAAEMLADQDGAEALAMLTPVKPGESQYTLQRLAERFAPTDPKKALLFVEEAVVRARALEQPNRAAALAQAGTVLIQLGRAEAGRKLIDEAVEAATRLGTNIHDGFTRGVVAQALAPFDANRALALVESTGYKDAYNGLVAVAIAEKDTTRAVALTDTMAGNGPYPDRTRAEIAIRIGADRTDESIRIIEGMKSFMANYARPEAFACLAIAVAPRDRPRAFALIDCALAAPVDQPRLYESWINSGGAMRSAADMAAAAQHIDYPDMNSVMMRVMTTRPSPSALHAFDPAVQVQSAMMAAAPLALIDPGAARALLEQIEARSGLDSAKLAEVTGRDWLRAWALVDLKKAETFFEAQLAAVAASPDRNLQKTGFFRMIEVLVLPPHRRAEVVFQMVTTGRPLFSN